MYCVLLSEWDARAREGYETEAGTGAREKVGARTGANLGRIG